MSNGEPVKPTPFQNSHKEQLQTPAPMTKEKVISKPSNSSHNMALGTHIVPNDVNHGYSSNNIITNPHNIVENEETTIIYEDYPDEAYG